MFDDQTEGAGVNFADHARLPIGIELLIQGEAADTSERWGHSREASIVAGAMIAFHAQELCAEPRERLDLAEPLVDDLQLLGERAGLFPAKRGMA
jgi:hypothetical protein